FWSGFDRDLQQKQLQALVRPSRGEKVRAALSTPQHALTSLSAVVAVCVAAAVAGLFLDSTSGERSGLAFSETLNPRGETMLAAAGAAESIRSDEDEAL